VAKRVVSHAGTRVCLLGETEATYSSTGTIFYLGFNRGSNPIYQYMSISPKPYVSVAFLEVLHIQQVGKSIPGLKGSKVHTCPVEEAVTAFSFLAARSRPLQQQFGNGKCRLSWLSESASGEDGQHGLVTLLSSGQTPILVHNATCQL